MLFNILIDSMEIVRLSEGHQGFVRWQLCTMNGWNYVTVGQFKYVCGSQVASDVACRQSWIQKSFRVHPCCII